MKTIKALSIFYLFGFSNLHAQSGIFPELSIGLNFGFSTLKLPSSNVQFSFTDESPSRDYISTDFNIPKTQRPFTLKPYMSLNSESGWQVEVNSEIGIGNGTNLLGLNCALLRRITNDQYKTLVHKIGLQVGVASAELYLGNIYQNDVYIQINGFKYYDDYLKVSYKESQLIITPIYQCDIYLGTTSLIRINLGYKLPWGVTNNRVAFSGDEDFDGKPHIEEVSMNYRDMEFNMNNKAITRKILNQQGLFVDLGFALIL